MDYRNNLTNPVTSEKTLLRCQLQARHHKPSFLIRKPVVKRQYIINDEGRNFLPTDIQEYIIDIIVGEDGISKNSDIILMLDWDRLLEITEQKKVELEVLLGVIIGYANEVKDESIKQSSGQQQIE